MDTVIRGVVVYLVVLVIFRIAGKRTLGHVTTFDLVLTLIISESIQEALIDDDHSLTHACLLVTVLVGTDILVSNLKQRWPWFNKLVEGTPVVLVEDGRFHKDRMRRERVEDADILSAAREHHGLERLEQVKHAVLEQSGDITIIPREPEPA